MKVESKIFADYDQEKLRAEVQAFKELVPPERIISVKSSESVVKFRSFYLTRIKYLTLVEIKS